MDIQFVMNWMSNRSPSSSMKSSQSRVITSYMIIKAVCITLNSQDPERAQRAISEIKKLGFQDVSFFEGVRVNDFSDDELKNLMTPRAYFELKNGRYVHEAFSGLGSIGCYLAHTNAWRKCIHLGEPLAIFEDDFVAKPNSKEIVERAVKEAFYIGFDILRFQHRNNPGYGEKLESLNSDNLLRVIRTEGLCAYIITPKAAEVLLERAFPVDVQIDHYLDMGCFYYNLKNYSTIPDLFDDPQTKSLINHNSLELYKDGFNSDTYHRHYKCIWLLLTIVAILIVIIILYRR